MKEKMNKKQLTNEEITFLAESNKIEGESSEIGTPAMDDAIKAWEYAKKQFKKNKEQLSISFILGIHKRLLQRLEPGYSGKIRKWPVSIGGEVRSQTKEEIIVELNTLIEEWNRRIFLTGSTSQTEVKEKQIKEYFVKTWHVGYQKIHPHSDGNGRTGRILMNLQRISLGLPIMIIYDAKKWEYYQWFRGAK
jgi:fido (protein-threonine AMPylation protein)